MLQPGRTAEKRQFPPVLCSCLRFLDSADPTISEPGTGYLEEEQRWSPRDIYGFEVKMSISLKYSFTENVSLKLQSGRQ